VKKKVTTGLKSLGIIILSIILIFLFGFGSITKFVFKKLLFTPYNIVGIIMSISTACGGYVTKRQGHWIKSILTMLSGAVSLFSFACTICSWFDIYLIHIIWTKGLKPAVINVGTVLLWILIICILLAVIGFAIYGLVKLILYIKEEKEWKENQKIYNSQTVLVRRIVKHNSPISTRATIKPQSNIKTTSSNNTSSNPTQSTKLESQNVMENLIVPNNYELKISNNICPKCGWYLKKRINSQTGEEFRGCSNFAYNDCIFTISNDEYFKIYKKYH